MSVRLTLLTRKGDAELKQLEKTFHEKAISIGRGESNLFRIPDYSRKVSSRHALIEFCDGHYYITDTGSKNGTRLNNRRLSAGKAYQLNAEDRIQIGDFWLSLSLVGPEAKSWAQEKTQLTAGPIQGATVDKTVLRPQLSSEKPAPPKEVPKPQLTQPPVMPIFESIPPPPLEQPADQGKAPSIEAHAKHEPSTQYPEADPALKQTAYEELCKLSSQLSGQEDTFHSAEEVQRFCRQLRAVYETMIQNFLDSLKGRKQFEHEFDVQVTRMLSWEKNPVKSAETIQDLGKFLLHGKSHEAQDRAVEQLDRAFRDLMLHQLGLLSGAKQSLHAFLDALNPEALEEEVLNAPNVSALKRAIYRVPPFKRRALWKKFLQKQKGFSEDQRKAFETIFGPNFSKGYIDLLKRIDQR
jgi:type VI secretion system protein ImpI